MPDSIHLAIRAAQQRQNMPTQDSEQVVMRNGQNLVDAKEVFREPPEPKPLKKEKRREIDD